MVAIGRRIALFIFCTVIALAPLPFGSVDEMVIGFWMVLLGVTTMLAMPVGLSKPQTIFFILALIFVFAWALVLHEQTSEHPWLARELADPIWLQTSRLLDVPLPQYVSVVRNQPFVAAGAQIVAFLSLLCGFLLGNDRAFAKVVLRTVAWSGAVYAIYAILSFIWDPTMLLWREKIAYRSVLTGTFINRNAAAIYFGACAIVWLLTFFRTLLGPSLRISADTHFSLLLLLRDTPRRPMLSFAMFILLLSATFMTGSRAGSLLLLLICAGCCLFSLRNKESGRKAVLGLVAGLIFAGAIVLMTVGSGVDARVGAEGLIDPARLAVYHAVLRLILEHPWLGTGVGTFAWIFPGYRPSEISAWGVWDRAHSTPLEIAAEQGIPFALLVFCAVVMIFFALINGVKTRRSGRIYPAAGLLLILLSTAHSLIDFSLQIPGLALVVFAVVGVGIAQSIVIKKNRVAVSLSRDIAEIAGVSG
jgi:O-antigen ligase